MKERPILFNADMVRAILDGRKTQTRRPVSPQPEPGLAPRWTFVVGSTARELVDKWQCSVMDENGKSYTDRGRESVVFSGKCPYGQPGDRLWVKESWYYEEHMHDLETEAPDLPGGLYRRRLVYRASQPDYPVNVGVGRHGWRPARFMPRWASRITRDVANVRVERLQDITEDDAIADAGLETMIPEHIWYIPGTNSQTTRDPLYAYEHVWEACYSKKGPVWTANLWVWVIEFGRTEA